jgi:hypothetical protein
MTVVTSGYEVKETQQHKNIINVESFAKLVNKLRQE